MINFNRVWAMAFRYTLNLTKNYDRLADMFYWPIVDILLWGLTGTYFVKESNNPNVIIIVLTGIIFWIVVWRAAYEIDINLLTELWDQNLINIFAAPLTLLEWITSFIIFGSVKIMISLIFAGILSFILYQYNIFIYGLWIVPLIISLLITGWVIGFIVAAFLIRYGLKIQAIAWAATFIIAPFSAPYYPLDTLPNWAQLIAFFIPASYIFEGMREILFTGTISYAKLVISFALNIIYLLLSIWFFIYMFKRSRKLGLGRLQ